MSTTTKNDNNGQAPAPKAFISYSWTTPEHEEWVLNLATELRESGVDVILDKWELREGADKYVYMEKMVTDPTVQKVIMICDRAYVEKANIRKGGVGTETQIITPELYEQEDAAGEKQKFVAVVRECDEEGHFCIPVFYKGRIHISMLDEQSRSANFEQLVRWIFDKPLHIKPPVGKTPAYIENNKKTLGTTALFRRAIDGLTNSKPHALAATEEYFDAFAENLETFRIVLEEGKEFDDLVVESIKEFLPYRDEAIDIFHALIKYQPNEGGYNLLQQFGEKLLPYTDRMHSQSQWHDYDFDNFRFIVHELFLYMAACLLKHNCFDGTAYFLKQGYYNTSPDNRGELVSFDAFRQPVRSFEARNRTHRRVSVHADLLKERAYRKDLSFEHIMQADFVLFIYASLKNQRWWPVSLLYASFHHHNAFEIFARAASKEYFDKIKVIFGIDSVAPLIELAEQFRAQKKRLPSYDYNTLDAEALMNFEKVKLLV